MNELIKISTSKLPENQFEKMNFLEQYFPEYQPIIVSENENYVFVQLEPPHDTTYYIEDLHPAIRWWDNKSISDIPSLFFAGNKGLISLLDSWSLLGWSMWLRSFNKAPPKEIVLLHLDDHEDLMSPKIAANHDNSWINLVNQENINFTEPKSIISAITNGAIGIGSMITPLVYFFDKISIFHYKQTINIDDEGNYEILKCNVNENILMKSTNRMNLKFCKNKKRDDLKANYFLSNNITTIVNNIPDNIPILFHVDMDFFNNRFNGCSDWESKNNRHDPGLKKQKDLMYELFESFKKVNLISRIQNTTIALSPGFYPSEYWEDGVNTFLTIGNQYGLDLADFQKHFASRKQ